MTRRGLLVLGMILGLTVATAGPVRASGPLPPAKPTAAAGPPAPPAAPPWLRIKPPARAGATLGPPPPRIEALDPALGLALPVASAVPPVLGDRDTALGLRALRHARAGRAQDARRLLSRVAAAADLAPLIQAEILLATPAPDPAALAAWLQAHGDHVRTPEVRARALAAEATPGGDAPDLQAARSAALAATVPGLTGGFVEREPPGLGSAAYLTAAQAIDRAIAAGALDRAAWLARAAAVPEGAQLRLRTRAARAALGGGRAALALALTAATPTSLLPHAPEAAWIAGLAAMAEKRPAEAAWHFERLAQSGLARGAVAAGVWFWMARAYGQVADLGLPLSGTASADLPPPSAAQLRELTALTPRAGSGAETARGGTATRPRATRLTAAGEARRAEARRRELLLSRAAENRARVARARVLAFNQAPLADLEAVDITAPRTGGGSVGGDQDIQATADQRAPSGASASSPAAAALTGGRARPALGFTLGPPRARAALALSQAAAYPASLYGLMAERALARQPALVLEAPSQDPGAVARLAASAPGRQALVLLHLGERALAERALSAVAAGRDEALARAALAVAGAGGLTRLQVQLASRLDPTQGALAAQFPIPPWVPAGGFTVDPALLFAIMRTESRFQATARNARSNASGLMQLLPSTADLIDPGQDYRGSGRGQLMDPVINLTLGQRYVEHLMATPLVGDDLIRVLCGYNAGPGNLEGWLARLPYHDPLLFLERIPFQETRSYVERVLADYWIYRLRMGQAPAGLDDLLAGRPPRYGGLPAALALGVPPPALPAGGVSAEAAHAGWTHAVEADDAGVLNAAAGDAGASHAGASGSGASDAGASDSSVLDARVLDARVLDAGVLDAGAAGPPLPGAP